MHRFVLYFCLVFFSITASANACSNINLEPKTTSDIPAVTEATLCLLNQQRTNYGLQSLTHSSPILYQSAVKYSQRMAEENFFSHIAPDGETMGMRLSEYRKDNNFVLIAENLAWGETYLATPESIVESWMNSPGHKDNILNEDLTEIGIGIVLGTPKPNAELTGATYTTHFGTRKTDIPAHYNNQNYLNTFNTEQVKDAHIQNYKKTTTKKTNKKVVKKSCKKKCKVKKCKKKTNKKIKNCSVKKKKIRSS